jgi:heme-degrading monooxygenase HmoA
MYTRITTGHYDATKEKDAQQMVGDTVLAAARGLPGFKSYNGSLDHHGKLVVVSTWETEQHAHDFRDNLDSDLMTQIRDMGVQLDEAQIYETISQV